MSNINPNRSVSLFSVDNNRYDAKGSPSNSPFSYADVVKRSLSKPANTQQCQSQNSKDISSRKVQPGPNNTTGKLAWPIEARFQTDKFLCLIMRILGAIQFDNNSTEREQAYAKQLIKETSPVLDKIRNDLNYTQKDWEKDSNRICQKFEHFTADHVTQHNHNYYPFSHYRSYDAEPVDLECPFC